MLSEFSIEIAKDIYNSTEDFPVDFDKAWQWLGFSRKDSAKRSLLESGFVKDIEFRISVELSLEPTSANPRPNEIIHLSIDCFKMWAMMAGTEQGKKVRLYFLECEKIAKNQTKPLLSPAEMLLASAQQLVNHEKRLEAIELKAMEAEADLKALPPATVEVQPLEPRYMIGRIVKDYAIANSLSHQYCWNWLYTEFRDRYHIDLKIRGKNHQPKLSGIEYALNHGHIDKLYSVAKEIFRGSID